MKIDTKFWENTNLDTWRHKTVKIYWLYAIICLANAFYFAIITNPILLTLNGLGLITGILAIKSFNKYTEEKHNDRKTKK